MKGETSTARTISRQQQQQQPFERVLKRRVRGAARFRARACEETVMLYSAGRRRLCACDAPDHKSSI